MHTLGYAVEFIAAVETEIPHASDLVSAPVAKTVVASPTKSFRESSRIDSRGHSAGKLKRIKVYRNDPHEGRVRSRITV